MTPVLVATRVLALTAQDSKVSPGVLGFLVVVALGVATWLLIRSMGRQLRRIDFDEDAVDAEPPASDGRQPGQRGAESPET